MHAEELDITPDFARALLARQFPDLAQLAITRLISAGTENTIFRLGDNLALRLPRIAGAATQATRESRWLPLLAPHLPLTVPEPVALGEPSEDYPWHWSVCRWLAGENAFQQPVADLRDAAKRLAQFVRALQTAPISGDSLVAVTSDRGVDLIHRDAATRAAIARCEGLANTKPLAEIWDQSLTLPVWHRAPVWLHGNLHVGNLLAENGRITGVIDWGSLGMGDPACDLMPAWSILDRESRALFRDEVNVDDATWLRGRAWAVSVAAIALP
jgi:aminoglycoside phosphotransferase (APT) family kinase protein